MSKLVLLFVLIRTASFWSNKIDNFWSNQNRFFYFWYRESKRETEKYEGKNTWWLANICQMAITYMLDKIKIIMGIENLMILKYWLTQIVNWKMIVTLKNVVILVSYVIKDGDKFYSQKFKYQYIKVSKSW